MNISKALEIRYRKTNAIWSIFNSATISRTIHHSQLMGRLIDVKDNVPNDTPKWVRYYLDGYSQALLDSLHKYELEFCYTIKCDDELIVVSTHSESPRHYSKYGLTVKEVHDLSKESNHPDGNFYWKGTDNIFF